jgi:hypothetical protein
VFLYARVVSPRERQKSVVTVVNTVGCLDVLGAHDAGDDQFADFEFEPTRPLGSAAPSWHRLLGNICCDPERSAV